MKPTQDVLDRMGAEGFSFLYNVDPGHEAQYVEIADTGGLVREIPISLTGELSGPQIIAKHAPKLGVQGDSLRVAMDAYSSGLYSDTEGKAHLFDPALSGSLSKHAAVFVRTTDLEDVLARHPVYQAFQPATA